MLIKSFVLLIYVKMKMIFATKGQSETTSIPLKRVRSRICDSSKPHLGGVPLTALGNGVYIYVHKKFEKHGFG